MLGGWEWLILAVVAILLFGGSRLAGVGKSAGQAIREFKEEVGTKPQDNVSDPPKAEPVLPVQEAPAAESKADSEN